MVSKTSTIHLDFETRSAVDLRRAGVHVYAADSSTTALCMAWAIDDGSPELWRMGEPAPIDLFLEIEDGARVVAWNAPFELAIWNHAMRPRHGWPTLPIEQTFCAMAMSYAMALPGALENAAKAVGIKEGKDMAGNRIMMQLSQPRGMDEKGNPVWWQPKDAPEKFEKLWAYCINDVKVEREVYHRLLPLSPDERRLWLLDQKINNRGVYVDAPSVRAAIQLVEYEKERLIAEIREVTGNKVSTPTAVAQIKAYLEDFGVSVPSLAKQDVVELLGEKALPATCRRALEIRQTAAKSSTAKLQAMVDSASADGRVRGCFQYHGAGTGRWAGRRLQLQNFPRGKMKPEEIDGVFELLNQIEVES